MYEVLRDGRVWSDRKNDYLKPRRAGSRQQYIHYRLNGRERLAHRLVAEKYVPNPDNKPCVNHIDGNPENNHFENLEWVTHRENTVHAEKMGLIPHVNSNKNGRLSGQGNGRSKLTAEQVRQLREVAPNRKRGERLWENYGISRSMYYNIVNGRNWQGR
jgi:hypothetical protein